MKIVSRKEAKAQGLKRYFTGKPCKNGHISERYTSGGHCVDCNNHLHRQWIDKSPENKRRNLECIKKWHENHHRTPEQRRKQYQKHKKKILAHQKNCVKNFTKEERKLYKKKAVENTKRWRVNNSEKFRLQRKNKWVKEQAIRDEEKRQYYEEHKEEIEAKKKVDREIQDQKTKDNNSRWQKEHPEKNRLKSLAYLARKNGAEGSYSLEDWKYLCNKFDNRCLSCGKKIALTVDHIQPLSKGGSNYNRNIQPLCQSCNSKKRVEATNFIPAGTFLFFPSIMNNQISYRGSK